MRRLGLLVAGLVSLIGCSPDYGTGGFACSNNECPSGYSCVTEGTGKVCRKSGQAADLGAEAQPPDPCPGKPDGTDCSPAGGTGFVCRGGKCQASRCGDDFVDPKSEDCDDGNDIPDDGCNACKFNCRTAGDCGDKNPCNGEETCDGKTHKCVPGITAKEGAACTLPNGTAGGCNGGTCAPAGCGNKTREGVEECDDGNDTDGDGCDNDCKFSCHGDPECDDKSVCTGQEVCKSSPGGQQCVSGVSLDCDDAKPCTNDSCDPVKGCLHVGIDADKDGHVLAPCGDDCNDADPSIFKGAVDCVDNKDNDCDKTVDPDPNQKGICWKDVDGDGYANVGAATQIGCSCPLGYTNKDPSIPGNADCQWALKDVFPGQPAYFTGGYCTMFIFCLPNDPNCTPSCASSSWDYNCVGGDEPQLTGAAGTCTKWGLVSCSGSGWVGAQPSCGQKGTYKTCYFDKLGLICKSTTNTSAVQACH